MKKIFITSLFLLASTSIFAQMEVNKQIQMTGAAVNDRRITNISNASAVTPVNTDALNIATFQSNYTNYGAGTFATGTYTLTLVPAAAQYWEGMIVSFKAGAINTGVTNLNVNGLGARAIVKAGGIALAAGDIQANQMVTVVYNLTGTHFEIIGSMGIDGWKLRGNTGTNPTNDFIGTTDAQNLIFRANNVERLRINQTDGEVIAGAVTSPYAGDLLIGQATAANTFAVNGYSAQNGSGTWGEILAASTTNFSAVQGVYGGSGIGAGVLGNYNGTNTSNTRAGVVGIMNAPVAAAAGAAVYGSNNIASGNQRMGVLGVYAGTAFGIGVHGIGFGGGIITGNNDVAVVGWRGNNANYSGYFNGNHVIANGTKSASVGTSKGNQLLYVTELPGVWFEDVGTAQLKNGYCEVKLDPMFLETIFVDDAHPMQVFLQEQGESNGLFVVPGKDGFIVKEKSQGKSNIKFSYRLMAKRLHFQDHRFGNDPVWGEGDTRKYSQYATPPKSDYKEQMKFQAEEKKNWKQTPMPEGFIDYMTIQKESQQLNTSKEALKKKEKK